MILFITLILCLNFSPNSWAQTTESNIDKSVFETPLKILNSDVSSLSRPSCEEEKEEKEYFQEALEYECDCILPEELAHGDQKISPLKISSLSAGVAVGNDNHLIALKNDDYGLTWYKEIMVDMDLMLKNEKTLFLSYDYFGGQYTQKIGKSFISPDGSGSMRSGTEVTALAPGEGSALYNEFIYLEKETKNGDFIRLNNQKSLSKTVNKLSGKYSPRSGYYLVSSMGHVAIDGDSNQKHAEKQQSHHKTAGLYNFRYEDFANQVEGFEKNVNYVFGSVGIGKEFKGEFLKGNCTLKAAPEISLQKNIRLQGPEGTIANWQPKAMMTLEAGFLKAKNNKSQRKIEILSNVKYDPNERLPEDVDPGNAGSVSASLKLNFYSKDLNFSKDANNSFQVGFYVIPVSISKGIGSSKNVLPSTDLGGNKNEIMGKWAVAGIVIKPQRKKK